MGSSRLHAGPWPIETERINAHGRDEVRAAWGVPDGARVLVAISEPAASCDAWTASYLGGVLTLATPPTWIVVPAGSDQIDRGLRFAERHGHPYALIVDDAPLPRLLAGADAALHTVSPRWAHQQRKVRAVGLSWAAAAGLPIVAEDSPAISSKFPELACTRIVPRGNRRALAHAMNQAMLADDLAQRNDLARQLASERTPQAFAKRAHERSPIARAMGEPVPAR